MRTLIQILPYRSQHPDGVGDYARLLATKLRDAHAIDSIFVVARPDATTAAVDDGFATICAPTNRRRAIGDAIRLAAQGRDIAGVLLHMSGYGYARFGAPFHLAAALRDWKARSGQPILSIFHELFIDATGFGRRKAYQKLQQASVRQFLQLSDDALTPAQSYRDWLIAQNPPCPVHAMPVFSTIGEASDGGAGARAACLAIFCRADMARDIYGQWYAALHQFCADADIDEIIDIGSRHTPPPERIGGAKLVAHGRLPAEGVRALLGQARYGLLAYQQMPLGKSTLFAAYAAHGVIPMCASTKEPEGDGLVAGTNFVHMAGMDGHPTLLPDDPAAMAAAVRAWYAPHRCAAQAASLAARLEQLAVRR